ncbi:hypothetical protein PIB30_010516 [Stylosanthes scabra]|uniref:Uncharacterized protein n=1 Tax=Stylosanthes scabra TaxID=79078 RepID=A0ABU6Q5I7_9FABA|nr:hypothetical protein [Stylosanthes scabra]
MRLTFSNLLFFRRNAHLPTLLGKSIFVTDDSSTSFSLDGTPITDPDIYKTTVNGIAGVLNYSLYGNGKPPPPPHPVVSSPPPNDVVMPPLCRCSCRLGKPWVGCLTHLLFFFTYFPDLFSDTGAVKLPTSEF